MRQLFLHALEICFLKLHPEMQKDLTNLFMKEMVEGIKELNENIQDLST